VKGRLLIPVQLKHVSEIAGVKEIGIFFRFKPLFPEFTCLAREKHLIMPVGSVFAALRRSR